MDVVCGGFLELYLLCLFVRFCYSYFIPSSVTGVTSYMELQGVTCYRRSASESLEDREGKQKAMLNRDAKKHVEVLRKRLFPKKISHFTTHWLVPSSHAHYPVLSTQSTPVI